MVLHCAPAVTAASAISRASRHVLRNGTRPLPAMTRFPSRFSCTSGSREAYANETPRSRTSLTASTVNLGLKLGRSKRLPRASLSHLNGVSVKPAAARVIIDGHQPPGLTRQQLLEKSRGLPHEWAEQRAWLGWAD